MYVERTFCQRPEDSTIIWRYLNFSKFVSMISSGELYFARLDKLGDDNYEGTLPRVSLIDKSDFTNLSLGEQHAAADKINKGYVRTARKQSQGWFANCWHINTVESDAMWKLYLHENDGVAIRSTFKRLKDSLKQSPQRIEIGLIKYIDYEAISGIEASPFIPGAAAHLVFHKRSHYEYENELRAFYWDGDEVMRIICGEQEENSKIGIPVHADLSTLIETIYCSPKSGRWFQDVVKAVLEKFGYGQKFSVFPSAMSREPFC